MPSTRRQDVVNRLDELSEDEFLDLVIKKLVALDDRLARLEAFSGALNLPAPRRLKMVAPEGGDDA